MSNDEVHDSSSRRAGRRAPGLGEPYVRRLYDWYGRVPVLYRIGSEVFTFFGRERWVRRQAVRSLELTEPATVLELGCGRGPNFAPLQDVIGPGGRLIAVDPSAGMLGAAKRRARRAGWANVEFRQTDAEHVQLEANSLDGALCTLVLNGIPDHRRAVAKLHAALKPGARFAVLCIHPFTGVARPLNLIFKPIMVYAAGWVPGRDLPADLRYAFGEVSVRRFNAGSVFLAVATKH